MPKGEISISYPGTTPALPNDWPTDRKRREIREWILENFVQESFADYDFSDWDNEDELATDSELSEVSTRQILYDHFGLILTAVEFEKIIKSLEKEFSEDWVPSDDRVDVDEVDEDEEIVFSKYSDVRSRIPQLIRHVAEVREALFPHLGHNNPPENLRITASDLEQLNFLLSRALEIDDEPTQNDFQLLDQLGEAAIRVGGEIVRYIAKKGDVYLNKAVEAAGSATGAWGPAALVLYYSGSAFGEFGRALIEFLSK